jgi:hypothetical protein
MAAKGEPFSSGDCFWLGLEERNAGVVGKWGEGGMGWILEFLVWRRGLRLTGCNDGTKRARSLLQCNGEAVPSRQAFSIIYCMAGKGG